jgi:hypothetical protein
MKHMFIAIGSLTSLYVIGAIALLCLHPQAYQPFDTEVCGWPIPFELLKDSRNGFPLDPKSIIDTRDHKCALSSSQQAYRISNFPNIPFTAFTCTQGPEVTRIYAKHGTVQIDTRTEMPGKFIQASLTHRNRPGEYMISVTVDHVRPKILSWAFPFLARRAISPIITVTAIRSTCHTYTAKTERDHATTYYKDGSPITKTEFGTVAADWDGWIGDY